MRELRFLEGLRLSAAVRPLIEALAVGVPAHSDDIDEQAIATALTDHADAWLACIAAATDRDAGWLARLSDGDGHALSGAMWSANRDFFGRRLVETLRRRRFAEALRRSRKEAAPSPSPRSSTPSSAPDTAADTATSPGG